MMAGNKKNLRVLKFVLSLFTLSCAVLLVAAPLVGIDVSYAVLAIVSIAFIFTALRLICTVRFLLALKDIRRRYLGSPRGANPVSPLTWRHLIVIPTFKEPLSTLEATIRHLSRHRFAATNYIVMCAQELADPEHQRKFRALQANYGDCFQELLQSVHALDGAECPGKASNVNHAVRSYVAGRPEADFSHTMVTVIDCDTKVNQWYFQEVERAASQAETPHAAVYAAPTLFESNRLSVPCFVRAVDDVWSLSAAANIFSNSRLGFPISNYSLSLRLAIDIDYWDVDRDSIGEDFHTFIKSFIKKNAQVRLMPIGVPMNNENVQSNSYLNSMRARFHQSLRHSLGISSSVYYLKHLFHSPFSVKRLALSLLCLEAHFFPLLYFGTGLYLYACVNTGQLGVYFQGGKLIYLAVLATSGFVMFNVMFFLYKYAQIMARRMVFNNHDKIGIRSVLSGVLDLLVQGYCAIGYYMVPFGWRMCQNVLFLEKTNYYTKQEEALRRSVEVSADSPPIAAGLRGPTRRAIRPRAARAD